MAINHFSGIVNYNAHKVLWGSFNIYGGVNDQSTDAGHQGTGLVAGVNFSRRMVGFEWGAGFGYAQDVQTVLATQVTSDYSYLANAKRDITRHLIWNTNYHGFHTGLGQLAGSGSRSQGFGTNLHVPGLRRRSHLRKLLRHGAAYRGRAGVCAREPPSGARRQPVFAGKRLVL